MSLISETPNTVNEAVTLPEFEDRGISLFIKREDRIHPFISGNKFRKLRYNLIAAQEKGCHTLLTFGGAFSNHIAATAYAAKAAGLKSVGIIRGDELWDMPRNPTLTFAESQGMRLHFVSREIYREKDSAHFRAYLEETFGDCYLLPEGGSNDLAVKGCSEILTEADLGFDYICCAVGTGTTVAGLAEAALPHQEVLGFPVLKGDFLEAEVGRFTQSSRWKLVLGYHFGGYAKVTRELVHFINDVKERTGIPLDPVYTGKMLFGLKDLAEKGGFPEGSRILAIHTGGLQGIAGMNDRLKNMKYPLLK